mgnify:CR=1 FL=1
MNTKKMVIALGLGILLAGGVYSSSNPGAFLVSCTPVVTYAVEISTPAGGLEFNAVNVNTTYINSSTATIRNSGNVSADWRIRGFNLDTWTLGATPGLNTARLLGRLNSSLADTFNVSNDLIDTAVERNMSGTQHAGDQNGDNVPANATRLLSIRLDSPTDTTVDNTQRFRIEIRAYPASTF